MKTKSTARTAHGLPPVPLPCAGAVAERVHQDMPPRVQYVARRLMQQGGQVAVVGGAVRDLCWGRPVSDWDLVTNVAQAKIVSTFERTLVPARCAIGVGVILEGHKIDVSPWRQGSTLEDDLGARDFTCNAMAVPCDRAVLVDPYGGYADMRAKLLRAVGNAQARLAEDPLRILRAARMVAQFNFVLDAHLAAAMPLWVPAMLASALERQHSEWHKLLSAPFAAQGLAVAQACEALGAIVGARLRLKPADFAWLETLAPASSQQILAAMLWRLGADKSQVNQALTAVFASRGRQNETATLIDALVRLPKGGFSAASWRRYQLKVGRKPAIWAAGTATPMYPHRLGRLRAATRGAPATRGELPIDGHTLLALGCTPHQVGHVLGALLWRCMSARKHWRQAALLAAARRLFVQKN